MKYSLLLIALLSVANAQYQPNWASLDTRPLPQWYDDAKFGIFIHWGVFSVPSFKSEWYWYNWLMAKDAETIAFHNKNYGPDFTYGDFGPMFKAEFFNATEWATLFENSGAKYVVLTTKHHEGFTLFPSAQSWNWNAMDVGPHRDLVGELATAVKQTSVKFGTYHSLMEWFNPIYLQDKTANYTTQTYVNQVLGPELYELITQYAPDVLWADGDWETNSTYWNSTEFLAWLFNSSPSKDTIVTNDRWGTDANCKHGSFYNCQDNFKPGKLVQHKWENCMTMQMDSWGYDRLPRDLFHPVPDLLNALVSTVAFGGNLLLNVGPTADGRILQGFQDRLSAMGAWLQVNGEAIYATQPWNVAQNQTNGSVFYTAKGSSVYAIFMQWPATDSLVLIAPVATANTQITLLGSSAPVTFSTTAQGLQINLPLLTPAHLPCDYAWTLKLDNLQNPNTVASTTAKILEKASI